MTVKEIFDLRKQGKIEEAYEAIRPQYAVHKGKYTTLCMFWTASDILKKRVKEGRQDEALKIFKALLRILPNLEDADGRAHSSIYYEAVMLSREMTVGSDCAQPAPTFMLDFVEQIKVEQMSDTDWKGLSPLPSPNGKGSGRQLPPVARQLLERAFVELEQCPTIDNALKVMPLLQESVRREPNNQDNRRYMDIIYRIMGKTEQTER